MRTQSSTNLTLEGMQGFHPRHRAVTRHGDGYRGPLGKLLRELRGLIHIHGGTAAVSSRAVGGKTERERRVVLKAMLVNLYRGGYKLCSPKNFRSKHVRAILQNWRDRGHAASTMATYISHLRTFCAWIEKPQLIGVIEKFCAENPGVTRRSTATERDKSAKGAGVDFQEIFRLALEEDAWVACQLLLSALFGLRARESWLFRPHIVLCYMNTITITEGTKGGRPRTLPLQLTPEQKAAWEWAKTFPKTPSESMIPRGYTVKRWAAHYYWVCRKIGLSRRGKFSVTPHSLRHGVLLDLYEGLTGVSAPVRGGVAGAADRHEDRAAREVVAEFAGHSRASVTSAYIGSANRDRSGGASTPKNSSASAGNIDVVSIASITHAQRDSEGTSSTDVGDLNGK